MNLIAVCRTTPSLLASPSPSSPSYPSAVPSCVRSLSTTTPRRAFWSRWTKSSDDAMETNRGLIKDLQKSKKERSLINQLSASRLQQDSIFADELGARPKTEADVVDAKGGRRRRRAGMLSGRSAQGASLVREHAVRAIDPDARSR
ncbi:MAG: hypothetical protein OK454_08965, partial [Thaumarchaeota archaeon]|nr:hypothetical protein [Nitrososphaerota archaeon]